MDTSPVQSSSKCGSDFSIERILSNDPGTKGHSVGCPEWLCCTRYRPPRLPRAVNGGGCRGRRAGRHARVPFTGAQAAALEAAYARAPYLAPPALRALAAALQLRDDRIKIWFQNRRARERREKCSSIAPPQAVTLPPTTSTPIQFIASQWSSPRVESVNSINIIMPATDNETSMDRLLKREASSPDSNDRSETPLDVETIED